jgi:hypothetical protein
VTEGYVTDILTVPDDRDALLARHRRLFPAAGPRLAGVQPMVGIKPDHECDTWPDGRCRWEADGD